MEANLKPQFDSIVMFSTADWDNPFWTNKQHMAFHLANRGYKVLYVESLGLRKVAVTSSDWMRIFRRLKKFFGGVKKGADGVWVLSPAVLPLHGSHVVDRFNQWFLRTQIKFWKMRLGFKNPIAWTYNPLVLDLIKSLGAKFLVYHCVDDLAAAPRLPREKIESEEKRMNAAADVVFVTSEVLRKKAQPYVRG
ncbi:MAG: glycosyltransferase family 1 protein, partial [Proteobacteria bacterium]